MERPLLEKFARWMDEAFTIPGTRIRVGWDPIINLIPGAGDAVTTVMQAAIVLITAAQYPWLPRTLVVRMMVNVLLDAALSAIPGVGTVGDVFFRASSRNARLLDRALAQRDTRGRASAVPHAVFLTIVGGIFIGAVAAVVVGAFLVLRWGWLAMTGDSHRW